MPQSDKWQQVLLDEGSSIRNVIENLNQHGMKLVLVVKSGGVLAGTISDGDVRRGILNGVSLDQNVSSILNKTPFVLHSFLPKEDVIALMAEKKIQQIPILDSNNKVIGLYNWDYLMQSSSGRGNTVVIMAGGRGTRLHPHTSSCPKPMLEIAGKPILEHILERCKSQGFSKFLVSVNYLGYMIKDYFLDGAEFGVEIEYLNEGRPLGTAGSLRLIDVTENKSTPIIVINGDVLSDLSLGDFLDFHESNGASATMAVREYELSNPFGVVEINNFHITGFKEKPTYTSYINAGIYALNKSVIDLLADDEYCDMPTLFDRVRNSSQLALAYPLHEKWIDIGRPDDLLNTRKIYSEKND